MAENTRRGFAALATIRGSVPAGPAVHREPGLEAAILEAPDQAAPYLVYSDWLQACGDARGMLIALQVAGQTAAANALIHEHRHTLLNMLDGREDVVIEWRFGFIEGIRITARDVPHQLSALDALFDAHSGAFVQSIAIDELALDHGRVVDKIRERAPATLARLAIGKPGTWHAPSDLAVRFPRMRREASASWADAVAKASAQKRLKVELAADSLPNLESNHGAVIDKHLVLLGLKAELAKQKPIGMVDALKASVPAGSLDAFVLALLGQWAEHETAAVKWAWDAAGPLGGDRTASFLGHHIATWSHARATQAIAHLAMIGTPTAITEIVTALSRSGGLRPRRDQARAVLEQRARVEELANVTQLIACSCPHRLVDSKPVRMIATQRWWFGELMIAGHRLSAEDFDEHVRRHPQRAELAATLVWAAFGDDDRVSASFVIGRETLETADGKPFSLDPGTRIGVAHPIELADREAWILRFERDGIRQTILQLGRPVFELHDEAHTIDTLHDYGREKVGYYAIAGRLRDRDWYERDRDASGAIVFARDFDRDQVTALAAFGDSISSVILQPYGSNVARTRFDRVHRITASEVLYDLEAAVGRVAVAPSTEVRQPRVERPARGPVVEQAKTGRAKCVVCDQVIEKDTMRVGIDRVIETPSYKGLATVWAHLACKDAVPELTGVTL